MDRNEAKAALDAVSRTDAVLAHNATWPLWRHMSFAGVETLIVVGFGLPKALWAVAIIIALGGLVLIMRDDRKRDGYFINGWSNEAARPATWACVAIVSFSILAIALTDSLFRFTPVVAAAGAFTVVGCTLASLWWEKLFRADLRRSAR